MPLGEVLTIEHLASDLGCQISSLPMKYLGLPLGASFKAKYLGLLLSVCKGDKLIGRKCICQRGLSYTY